MAKTTRASLTLDAIRQEERSGSVPRQGLAGGWPGHEENRSSRVAARRVRRCVWGAVGSVLLVWGTLILLWLLDGPVALSERLLSLCVLMMQRTWGTASPLGSLLTLTTLMVCVLLASGGWAAGRLLAAWQRTQRLGAHSEPYTPHHWPGLDTALEHLPIAPGRLRILPTTRMMAYTTGFWRPHMVVSTGIITSLTASELQAVLSHEWEHVCRRDPWRLALLRWCSDALWFLPIVRVVARHGARAMEEAADDAAVALSHNPLDLATALVKTAKAQALPSSLTVPAAAEPLTVTTRVERLLGVVPVASPSRHYGAWTVSLVVVGCVLALIWLPGQLPPVDAYTLLFSQHTPVMDCYIGTM